MKSILDSKVIVPLAVVTLLWMLLLISYLREGGDSLISLEHSAIAPQKLGDVGFKPTMISSGGSGTLQGESLVFPKRFMRSEQHVEPPPLDEYRANLTRYLHTLHANLAALAGPHVDPVDVWDTYLQTTKSLLMKWDDDNMYRFPRARKDKSVFVSLGTYRDPYCPMTLKSLYAQAANPERLYVGLLQQNCFEKHCRTGVLVGGKVEDTSTDMNCYTEFCNSPEGKKSGACHTDKYASST